MPSQAKTKRQSKARAATPKLQVIEGAQSIYREGDKVFFEVEGAHLTGIVESAFIKDGQLWVGVKSRLSVRAAIIERVERAEREVS